MIQPLGGGSPTSYTDTAAFQSLPVTVQDLLVHSLSISELNALFPTTFPNLPQPLSLNEFFATVATGLRSYQHTRQLEEFTEQRRGISANLNASLASLIVANMINTVNQININADTQARIIASQISADIFAATNAVSAEQQAVNALNQYYSSTLQPNATALISHYNTFIAQLSQIATLQTDGTWKVNPSRFNDYNTLVAQYNARVTDFNNYWSGPSGSVFIDTYNHTTSTVYAATLANINNDLQSMITLYLTPSSTTNSWFLPNPTYAGALGPHAAPPPNIYTLYPNLASATPTTLSVGSSGIVTVPSPITNPTYNWIHTAATQTSSIPSLNYNPVYDASTVIAVIKSNIINATPQPSQATIQEAYASWAYFQMKALFNPMADNAIDPFSTASDSLIQKLLSCFLSPQQPISSQTTLGTSGGEAMTVLSSPNIQAILGKQLLTQAFADLGLDLNKEQIEQFKNQLAKLLPDFLQSNALQAIIPTFSNLSATDITSLPPNSPVYPLLFSIAFANSLQTTLQQGTIEEAITTFIQNTPELAELNLPPEKIQNLANAIHTTLLLIAVKLIAKNLGLPQLTSQLLASLLPPGVAQQVLQQAEVENQDQLNQLEQEVENAYIAKGLNPEQAKFLAELVAILVSNGSTLSHAPSKISKNNINVQLLLSSITANLVLGGLSLEQAQTLAESAVGRLLNKDFQSPQEFRHSLTVSLRNLNVPNAHQVANQAVLVPPEETRLTPVYTISEPTTNQVDSSSKMTSPPLERDLETTSPSTPQQVVQNTILSPTPEKIDPSIRRTVNPHTIQENPSKLSESLPAGNIPPVYASSLPSLAPSPFDIQPVPTIPITSSLPLPTTPTPIPLSNTALHLLSENQIVEIITERILALIPEANKTLAQEIPRQLALVLYGTYNPDSGDRANLKNPNSLVNAIKDQLYQFKMDQNTAHFEAVATTFKETIKDSVELDDFLVKLMDPANALLYSAGTGIIYGGHGSSKDTKSIDIIV